MKIHELKTWPEYYKEIVAGRKTFEVRKNDREYKVGDILHLREWEPGNLEPKEGTMIYIPIAPHYTGSELLAKVEYILSGGKWGIEEGYCVMSIKVIG